MGNDANLIKINLMNAYKINNNKFLLINHLHLKK